jgi:Raf kinase inhibitor-like YbhB/YbcL family protein
MKIQNFIITITLIFMSLGCSVKTNSSNETKLNDTKLFIFNSTSFKSGDVIPKEYAGNGDESSPQLSWFNPPANTKKYAIVMDDESVGLGDDAWVHWGVFNIPNNITSLKKNVSISYIDGVLDSGYSGPLPPRPQEHIYRITLYALSATMPNITTNPYFTRSQFKTKYSAYILKQITINGRYSIPY